MRTVSNIPWIATAAAGRKQWIGVQSVDVALDTNWLIYLQGAKFDTAQNIAANYVMVDNISNNGIVTITIGPIVFKVPQFTRRIFRMADLTESLQVNITTGIVVLYFADKEDLLTNDANLYAISTSAGVNVVYTFVTYTAATVNQSLAADSNKQILFARAGAITYNLLATAGIPNGFFNPSIWNLNAAGGTDVVITPFAGDTLICAGYSYTNANPYTLKPNREIMLTCDGVTWYATEHNVGLQTDRVNNTYGFNCPAVADNQVTARFGRFATNGGVEITTYPANIGIQCYDRVGAAYKSGSWIALDHVWYCSATARAQLAATGNFASTSFRSASGLIIGVASGVWTTIETLTEGGYLVTAFLSTATPAANYGAVCIAVSTGVDSRIAVIGNAVLLDFQIVAGNDIQVRHQAGFNTNITYIIQRLRAS